MQPNKTVSIDDLPENTALAAYELISRTFREFSEVLYIRVSDVTDEGVRLGGIEITIRKTAESDIPQVAALADPGQPAIHLD